MEAWRHELACNLWHEIFESRLMAKGMDYDSAHDKANAGEMIIRSRFKYEPMTEKSDDSPFTIIHHDGFDEHVRL